MQETLSAARNIDYLADRGTDGDVDELARETSRSLACTRGVGGRARQGADLSENGLGQLGKNKIKTVEIKIHTTWHTCNASAQTKKRQQYSGGMLV